MSDYTNHYTNPAQNLLRTTNNNRTQEMSEFALSMRMRSTNRTPPRTLINKCFPRWQRGGQGFDPPRLHPLCANNITSAGHNLLCEYNPSHTGETACILSRHSESA